MNRLRLSRIAPVIALVLLLGLYLTFQVTRRISPSSPPTPSPESQGKWEVFFSQPIHPSSLDFEGGPDEQLARAIEKAAYGVDLAAYDLNLWSIRDALLDAHRRGVRVRMVMESDNGANRQVMELIRAGIEVHTDMRDPLMHHKFVVIDGLEVWTGSMNFTINGAYRNNNNLIHLRSQLLADNFSCEFEEMFINETFGALSPADTPHPVIEFDGGTFLTYFSPDDGAAEGIIEAISSAKREIRFMAFSLTMDEIGDALLARAEDGVDISGVVESHQAVNPGSEFERLTRAGLDVRLDGNPNNMHHKVFIIDQRVVITGSYNFSHSAEFSNDENVLILHDSDIANEYLAEFEKVFTDAEQ